MNQLLDTKINSQYLSQINETDCLKYFGNWVNDVDLLHEQFKNAEPFQHLVIKNFLNEEYVEKLHELFPTNVNDSEWYKYENPIEVKYAHDNINLLPDDLKNYFYFLSSNQLVSTISKLTGIHNLEYDEYLHGAGLHAHPRYGRLSIHLDYEKHPISGKERRTNIILFLTKNWNSEWGGANELWDQEVKNRIVKNDVEFNTAIIFKTNDISWHGVPDIMTCPEGILRKSLAFYYISPLSSNKSEEEYRFKAKFVKRPSDVTSEGMDMLYKIRPFRRITQEDIEMYTPNWKKEEI